ncbi:MAG: flagellar hook-length control protein FliK [Rhodospirillales bacterium]|nr:flagellar hook-length control protein FliK [Rhodospirillales bacterium]
MDVSTVKAKNITDVSAGAKTKSTAEQLMGDFSAAVAKRMNMSNFSVIGRGQNSLSNAIGNGPDTKTQAKPEPKSTTAAPRDDHQPRERAEAPRADRENDARPAEAKADAPREASPQDAPRSETNNGDHDGDVPPQDHASSEDGSAQNNNNSQQKEQSGDTSNPTQASENSGETPVAQNTTGQGEQIVAAVIDVVVPTVTTQVGSETQVASNDGKKAQDADTLQQTTAKPAAIGEQSGDPELAQDANTQKKADLNPQQQSQTQAQANTAQRQDNHAVNADPTLKQQQAADIASKLSADQKVDVTVTVNKQSEHLVSQPTSNLAAQSAMADDADGAGEPTTTQNTAVKAAPTTLQPAAPQNNGNPTGQQSGNETQQQLQMAQAEVAKTAAAGETKTQAAQAAANNAATTATTIKVGGMEGVSNAQSATQPTVAQPQNQTAAAQKPATPHAQARAQVTDQVNVQISKAIADGMDKINIQLRPAHLGRVEVQLEMTTDGRVTAMVTADNKDTLDLLKQDSRELQRAMREAGLQMDSGDLSFNLRENGNQTQGGSETDKRGQASGSLTKEPSLDELLEANTKRPNIISEDRVDITA